MFKHILVPVDFTEQTSSTLQLAQRMAAMDNGRLTILHVIELIAGSSTEGELKEFYEDLRTQAEEKLAALLVGLGGKDGRHSSAIAYGERVAEILAYAEENEVDLIIMRSHKVDPNDPSPRWGTISQKVGILAPCPVLLVK